jgi:hypothetical protein
VVLLLLAGIAITFPSVGDNPPILSRRGEVLVPGRGPVGRGDPSGLRGRARQGLGTGWQGSRFRAFLHFLFAVGRMRGAVSVAPREASRRARSTAGAAPSA